MSDFTVVDPKGWEYDLHSIYSAYIGYFQLHAVPWYDRSWGHLFASFPAFLAFSWPAITVTDAWTHRPHIVTRHSSVGAFGKMVKTRFGETIPQPPNILVVTPFESTPRPLRTLADYPAYKRLYATLPATALSALKARVRAGDPAAVRSLWGQPQTGGEDATNEGDGGAESNAGRDKTFLAIDFEWNERNVKSVLEWGYAAVRCGHLDALGHWPPVPDTNYRKGHYIVAEHVDKVLNRHTTPSLPWHYAFGDSQVISKATLPQVIQAVISSLASPDSETTPNTLVLVAHGVGGDLARLEEMGIKLPHNVLILDTAAYERALYSCGFRGIMPDPKTPSKPRAHGTTLSLENLLRSLTMPVSTQDGGGASPVTPTFGPGVSPSFGPNASTSFNTGTPPFQHNSGSSSPISPSFPQRPTSTTPASAHMHLPNVAMHNAGNDAFMCLFALQALLEPTTRVPSVRKARGLGGPLADPRQIVFGGMTPQPVYPAAYQATNGGGGGYQATNGGGGGGPYLRSPQPAYQQVLYTGGYAPALSSPTLVIPNRKMHTPPGQSPTSMAFPPTALVQLPSAGNGLQSSFAAVGKVQPPSVSESESCPSSPSAGTSSAASVAYDLAAELGRMQVERTDSRSRSRSPGPGVYLQLQVAGVDGNGGLGVGVHEKVVGTTDKGKGKEERRLSGVGLEAITTAQCASPSPRRNVWMGRGGAAWKK